MKKLTFITTLILVLVMTVSCGKLNLDYLQSMLDTLDINEIISLDTTAVTDGPAEETEEKTDAVSVDENRPKADGQQVLAYDLSFYLPSTMTANEYNGMLGVYNFYTGDYITSTPTGMNLTLMVSDESITKGDFEGYSEGKSRLNSGEYTEPERVTYNGHEWLRFAVSENMINYYAVFNGGMYEIVTKRGGETKENYDAAIKMMEQTLYFASSND